MEQNIPDMHISDAVLLSSDEDLEKYDPTAAEKLRGKRRLMRSESTHPTARPGQGGTKRCKTRKKSRKKI